MFAYSRAGGDWEDWPWQRLDAVIVIDDHDVNLMCEAHKYGVQYGTLGRFKAEPCCGSPCDGSLFLPPPFLAPLCLWQAQLIR